MYLLLLSEKQLSVKHVIVDEGVGSLFGAVLSVADVDGDGTDELLVGAPAFVSTNSHHSNIGAVYIYKNINPVVSTTLL